MLHWMPHYSVREWMWCLCEGRNLIARARSNINFTDITEWQAVGHDTVWRNSHISVNDLQHPLLFHLLVLCQSPFPEPSLLFLCLIPLKYTADHFAILVWGECANPLMPELVAAGFWKVLHHCSRGCCHPVQVPEFTSLTQGHNALSLELSLFTTLPKSVCSFTTFIFYILRTSVSVLWCGKITRQKSLVLKSLKFCWWDSYCILF